jgi:hypothetical protein
MKERAGRRRDERWLGGGGGSGPSVSATISQAKRIVVIVITTARDPFTVAPVHPSFMGV